MGMDTFAASWNNHRIRGPCKGIPEQLFTNLMKLMFLILTSLSKNITSTVVQSIKISPMLRCL